ncbi:MAG: hypothetical protein HKN07_14220 [Acidimicrobiia bacterium]|nr:hypothetical protein [Acidimicrobiia bacterium]
MKPHTAVVVGMGEMGSVFARGFLKSGHQVFPVLRSTDLGDAAASIPDPIVAVVAVGEADLDDSLDSTPQPWRDDLVLLQNELLPRDWQRHGLENPTVIVVWFEKKKGMDTKVIIPSPVHGPASAEISAALATLDIPTIEVDAAQLVHELVRKNLYILTANIAGLDSGGTVAELWAEHRDLAAKVAHEILDIQARLAGPLDRDALVDGMVEAFDADPDHGTTGRSAPARLARAIGHARQLGIETPTLDDIASRHGVTPDA